MVEWPLLAGHRFGVNPFNVQVHDGAHDLDSYWLRLWQRDFARLWPERDMYATGRYDGPTQRACLEIQKRFGLPVTGDLDQATWEALYIPQETPLESTESAENPGPVELPTPYTRKGVEGFIESRAERIDKLNGSPAAKTAARIMRKHNDQSPDWWTQPIGPGSPAEDVRKVRSKLGMVERYDYAESVAQRVKGLQKTGGLLVTGHVDAATAWLLEELAATP